VIVSGTGGTREIALNNAFRHAVEQAVGMMVSSESYVKNLKDIQDKVFLVSNGFIEQYKVLTENHDTTGYAVTISAVVRQKQLKTAMSSATNTVIPLDGGALFANQMLKEDKTNSYAKVIANLIDDLIANGFEYKYDSPKVEPVVGNAGTYKLVLSTFDVYLKKDWLSGLSKYRDIIGNDEELFKKAIMKNMNLSDYDKSRGWDSEYNQLDDSLLFLVELKDAQGNTISHALVFMGDYYCKLLCVDKILGVFQYSKFRYPNITDDARNIRKFAISFDAIDAKDLAKISKVTIQAVAVKDYGGNLPIYNKKNGEVQ